MPRSPEVSTFLKSAGGIAVAFSWSVPTVLAQQAARPDLPGSLGTNRMLDGWIRINPAGTVTVFTGKCELGQGILTALAQIAAEELDVAYERVEMVSADTARTPNEGHDRRQPVGREQRHGAALRLRRGAPDPVGAGRREARRRRRQRCPYRTER